MKTIFRKESNTLSSLVPRVNPFALPSTAKLMLFFVKMIVVPQTKINCQGYLSSYVNILSANLYMFGLNELSILLFQAAPTVRRLFHPILIAFCKLIYVFNDCDNMEHILKAKACLTLYSQHCRLFKTVKKLTLLKYLLYHWMGESTKGRRRLSLLFLQPVNITLKNSR